MAQHPVVMATIVFEPGHNIGSCIVLMSLPQQLDKSEKRVVALSLEADSLKVKVHYCNQEVAELRQQLVASQDALQQVTCKLKKCQRELREQVRMQKCPFCEILTVI